MLYYRKKLLSAVHYCLKISNFVFHFYYARIKLYAQTALSIFKLDKLKIKPRATPLKHRTIRKACLKVTWAGSSGSRKVSPPRQPKRRRFPKVNGTSARLVKQSRLLKTTHKSCGSAGIVNTMNGLAQRATSASCLMKGNSGNCRPNSLQVIR